MPREIADSDDEADFALVYTKTSKMRAYAEAVTASTAERNSARDPLLDLDFDQFLSPTQRISQLDGNNDNSDGIQTSFILDSSTDRFLSEVAPVRSSIGPNDSFNHSDSEETGMSGKKSKKDKTSRKRSLSQIDEGTSNVERGSVRKRTKTYGSGSIPNGMSRSMIEPDTLINSSSKSNDLVAQEDIVDNDGAIDLAKMVSIETRTQYTSPLDLSLYLSPTNCTATGAQDNATATGGMQVQSYVPHQPYTPQGGFFGAKLQGGTTSRSSIGNYQSFSIDPSVLRVDYDKFNPFESLSQVSLEGEPHTEQVGATDRNTGELEPSVQELHKSSLHLEESIDVPEQLVAQEKPPQGSPPFSPITIPDDDNPDMDPMISAQDLNIATTDINITRVPAETIVEPLKAMPKKRGRKPKQKKVDDLVYDHQNDVDELQMDEPYAARAVRAGTVDSTSNISEISQGTTASKTATKRNGKKSDMAPPEVLSKKLPSSDLGLDNKAMIGLSPERYVPRPSKRRGRAEIEPEPVAEAVPSEVDDMDETSTAERYVEQPTKEEPQVKPAPVKGKKGRKGKAKQVKTSTATLLKQDDNCVDEEEKDEANDMIHVDEHAATLKHRPLSEFTPDQNLKKEVTSNGTEEDAVQDENADKHEEAVGGGGRCPKLTVDVPIFNRSGEDQNLGPPKPEPKKRGRKRKQIVEDANNEPNQDSEQTADRSALVDKDANIQAGHKMSGKRTSQPAEESNQESDELDKENSARKHTIKPSQSLNEPEAVTPVKAGSTSAADLTQPSLKTAASTPPLFNARARIGLSKRHSIPSLLRKVDRNKEAPKTIERKEKLNKRQMEEREQERIAKEEAEAEGRDYIRPDMMRGKDGLLVEWDF